jgi:hypothetical protein
MTMRKAAVIEEVDEVTRCHRVREDLDLQFKSIDDALAFVSKTERARSGLHPAQSARRLTAHFGNDKCNMMNAN